ncbi:MAG: AAA family ATPase [Mucilaginibacter sp.]
MQTNHQPTYYTRMDQLDEICSKVLPGATAEPEVPGELLFIRDANTCLKQASERPVPNMLFGKFWYEGELCILYADSNLGKSILAVQMGNCISKGRSMHPFLTEARQQPVLYCDFELTDKQFEARYSDNYANHYTFTNFYRAEMNTDTEMPEGFKDFDEYLAHALERAIVQSKVKVIIIDNLTYLRNETEQAKDALPLMKNLKALKNKYGLSILALAHTPKRDLSQEITRNDLQGSKMLMNFCDSAFTIGESNQDKSLRYLKQIKQRNTEQVYGAGNVCLCRINKPSNFLQYEFVGYGSEAEHLRKPKPEKEELISQAVSLRQQGLSLREIAAQLNITHQKVDRVLKSAGCPVRPGERQSGQNGQGA